MTDDLNQGDHTFRETDQQEPENGEPSIDNNDQLDEDASRIQNRLLAIHIVPDRPGDVQIGAAFVDVSSGHVNYLGRTIGWEGDFQFIADLLLQLAEPVTTILVSTKTKEAFLESLKVVSSERRQPSENSPFGDVRATKVALLPSGFFDYSSACHLIATKLSAQSVVGSVIDLSNRASVQATGALLAHVQRIFPDLPPIEFDMVSNY